MHLLLAPIAAVLLDRDGTLVRDVPYNGDPERVIPVPGARRALDRLRAAGVAVGIVTNQSAIGRGIVHESAVAAVNERVRDLLGPFACLEVCPHAPAAMCGCRKPAPGLVHRAAEHLGVPPARCTVIGDRDSDVEAAHAAGAQAILVPSIAAPDLNTAVDIVLDGLLAVPSDLTVERAEVRPRRRR